MCACAGGLGARSWFPGFPGSGRRAPGPPSRRLSGLFRKSDGELIVEARRRPLPAPRREGGPGGLRGRRTLQAQAAYVSQGSEVGTCDRGDEGTARVCLALTVKAV